MQQAAGMSEMAQGLLFLTCPAPMAQNRRQFAAPVSSYSSPKFYNKVASKVASMLAFQAF